MKKIAVITGGTKGIGKSCIMKFAAMDFDIITNSRDQHDLDELKHEVASTFGTTIHTLRADFSIKSDVFSFGDFVKEHVPHVNVLINNAGIFLPGQSLTENAENHELQIMVNLSAPYYLCRLLQHMIPSNGDGYIFNICSTASITPYINGGSYCISKFGLLGFTKVLRQELMEKNIAVSAVMPGPTFTHSWSGTSLPENRFMTPSHIADAIFNAWTIRKSTVVEEMILRPILGDIT
jgi:short-subunit dehydrogenase